MKTLAEEEAASDVGAAAAGAVEVPSVVVQRKMPPWDHSCSSPVNPLLLTVDDKSARYLARYNFTSCKLLRQAEDQFLYEQCERRKTSRSRSREPDNVGGTETGHIWKTKLSNEGRQAAIFHEPLAELLKMIYDVDGKTRKTTSSSASRDGTEASRSRPRMLQIAAPLEICRLKGQLGRKILEICHRGTTRKISPAAETPAGAPGATPSSGKLSSLSLFSSARTKATRGTASEETGAGSPRTAQNTTGVGAFDSILAVPILEVSVKDSKQLCAILGHLFQMSALATANFTSDGGVGTASSGGGGTMMEVDVVSEAINECMVVASATTSSTQTPAAQMSKNLAATTGSDGTVTTSVLLQQNIDRKPYLTKTNPTGRTLLQLAILRNDHALVKLLLQYRADCFLQEKTTGWSALHFAVNVASSATAARSTNLFIIMEILSSHNGGRKEEDDGHNTTSGRFRPPTVKRSGPLSTTATSSLVNQCDRFGFPPLFEAISSYRVEVASTTATSAATASVPLPTERRELRQEPVELQQQGQAAVSEEIVRLHNEKKKLAFTNLVQQMLLLLHYGADINFRTTSPDDESFLTVLANTKTFDNREKDILKRIAVANGYVERAVEQNEGGLVEDDVEINTERSISVGVGNANTSNTGSCIVPREIYDEFLAFHVSSSSSTRSVLKILAGS
ncbi:unnamed protein product [Amoebophrya sp. A120]|nr:unnamed protein product [Amoebophrya sp. A120]|eukprot:GSA120T00023882001.1